MNQGRTSTSPPTMSKFTRLAMTHALMMGGDAAMVVALADSFFFSVDLDAARTQVLLFLAVSFAPFLFIAPLIGPLIDRMAGGRRLVIAIDALLRVLLLILMSRFVDDLALFPLVFVSLVLQKTYVISKQAIVPSTVRSSRDLVEANSKLGLVSGLTGAVAIVPAAILLKLSGAPAALLYGAVLFFAAFVSALRLPRDVVAASEPDEEEERELHSASLQYASIAMAVLRAAVGFTFFHLAFWLRSFDNGTVLFGAAVAASAFSTMAGNALAPRIRSLMREETMLFVALILSSVAGLAFAAIGEPAAGIGLVAVLNFVAALGRLAFESIVQRDAPEANQGRAFATFETRFQFAWAVAAFIAVAVQAPGPVGLLIVGVTAGATAIHLFIRARRPGRSRSGNAPPSKRGPASSRGSSRNGATRRRRPPRGPTTGPGRRSRSGSESRKRR